MLLDVLQGSPKRKQNPQGSEKASASKKIGRDKHRILAHQIKASETLKWFQCIGLVRVPGT